MPDGFNPNQQTTTADGGDPFDVWFSQNGQDLDKPESITFFGNGKSDAEDPYALPKNGSMDWENLPNGTARDSSGVDDRVHVTGSDADRYDNNPPGNSLWDNAKGVATSLSSFVKDNKELSLMLGSGIAGAFKDKSAKELSQAQIDYLKQKQEALNSSVTAYGKTYQKG